MVADAANSAKNRFIAVVSHELRTPLNPVLISCSMLLKDARLDADVFFPAASVQIRKPPMNAFALLPALHLGGNTARLFTLPPPRTMSSGSSVATRRETTSVMYSCHFTSPKRLKRL
jgi:signal transduction histidine kinase